jgi:hypothetical protein
MRRKPSAPEWKYPRRLTDAEWRRLPYRHRHFYLAHAQCDLLGYFRDCAKQRCRRGRTCWDPLDCYWERKRRMSEAEIARMDALCAPLRALLPIGSSKGSEGLWLF